MILKTNSFSHLQIWSRSKSRSYTSCWYKSDSSLGSLSWSWDRSWSMSWSRSISESESSFLSRSCRYVFWSRFKIPCCYSRYLTNSANWRSGI